ncbi:conjugal transfer protein TraG [Pseudomonas putida]|uniref:Conjugal transfer protein TraG n=3 Tax=Pseudomonas TaxID=286 RepID=A0A0P7CWZ4_PSEPU|nr:MULTISPECIES: EexN family lipoprotein [Pseudomonas]KPM59006.1 conjugal transfer protein TraG [Pseudomonas putida]MCO7527017.1 EexN family lipoprotein [Pseudomonas asiatica]MCT8163163.1 EexN family lipoprotein [Pseudomonas sp. HD6422]MCT8182085.1 EexN family lipoprotein [Pseudomonas sp. HD6421]MCV4270950.1 EexN family lipoprotein [Pseudomonas capsici]
MTAYRFSIVALFLLTGCGADESVHSVDWYKAHSSERDIRIAECERHAGTLALTPNCVNAKQARNEQQLDQRGYRKREMLNLEGQ